MKIQETDNFSVHEDHFHEKISLYWKEAHESSIADAASSRFSAPKHTPPRR